jgi:hypothetical protein
MALVIWRVDLTEPILFRMSRSEGTGRLSLADR